MLGLPIVFRFLLMAFAGAIVATVASSKKDFALLAGTFLLGLGALEVVLNFFGIKTFQVVEGDGLGTRSWLKQFCCELEPLKP